MKIDYNEICTVYGNIIRNIFRCLNEDTPPIYDKENHNFKYSDEYLNAYGYLQKAEWRLADTEEMKNHWVEEDFVHYGLENLLNVRNRISHYLHDTDFKFPDCVYDYKKYDDVLKIFCSELRNTKGNEEKFTYYMNLHYHEGRIVHIKWLIEECFGRNINEIESFLSNQKLLDNMHYYEFEKIIDELEEADNHMNEAILAIYDLSKKAE